MTRKTLKLFYIYYFLGNTVFSSFKKIIFLEFCNVKVEHFMGMKKKTSVISLIVEMMFKILNPDLKSNKDISFIASMTYGFVYLID